MTHREIIEAAINLFSQFGVDFKAPWQKRLNAQERKRFTALELVMSAAVLSERERCAQIADSKADDAEDEFGGNMWNGACSCIADAIRAQSVASHRDGPLSRTDMETPDA